MNHVDELISASLSGDLSDVERRQLDMHLADCGRCRATLAAFADQRRLLSGMRHVPVPRDLAPRVRSGIESGRHGATPWWRRPGGILTLGASLATAAVAVALAVFLFNRPIQVATSTPTPSASAQPATATPLPTESLTPTPSPSASAEPSPSVIPISNDPAGYLVYTLKDGRAAVTFVRPGAAPTTLNVPSGDTPLAAKLSPDGAWLAFRLNKGLKGTAQTYAYAFKGAKLVDLGESLWAPYGIGAEIAWSPDSRYLAYSLSSPSDSRSDAWLFAAASGERKQLTNTGDAFAASWMPNDGSTSLLWVSRAAAQPSSYLVAVEGSSLPGPLDPANGAVSDADGFMPLVAPDGKHVILWRGSMGTPGGHWSFGQGGMPYLASATSSGTFDFAGAQQLFPSLVLVGGEGFNGASIAWGPDSDAFAVWNTSWAGQPQPAGFPDSARVYFGHVSNGKLITAAQALDSADTSSGLGAGDVGGSEVIDVAMARDGTHLALTVQTGSGSEGGTFGATAELRYITRGLGSNPDVVKVIGSKQAWNGPVVFGTIVSP